MSAKNHCRQKKEGEEKKKDCTKTKKSRSHRPGRVSHPLWALWEGSDVTVTHPTTHTHLSNHTHTDTRAHTEPGRQSITVLSRLSKFRSHTPHPHNHYHLHSWPAKRSERQRWRGGWEEIRVKTGEGGEAYGGQKVFRETHVSPPFDEHYGTFYCSTWAQKM